MQLENNEQKQAYYTIIQAAREAGITECVLRKAVHEGHIKAERVSKKLLPYRKGMPVYVKAISHENLIAYASS